jgi:hypothetical protein
MNTARWLVEIPNRRTGEQDTDTCSMMKGPLRHWQRALIPPAHWALGQGKPIGVKEGLRRGMLGGNARTSGNEVAYMGKVRVDRNAHV